MPMRIEVVAQVGEAPYSRELILQQFEEAARVINRHGEDFTGRPTTHLLVTDSYVIKQRTEYSFKEKDARRFIQQSVERERRLGLYHPEKSWFLIFDEGTEYPVIANITPRLSPLTTLSSDKRYHTLLDEMFRSYLAIAAEHEHSLDIALSNFAIDKDGRLYYIDDDVYGWDNFTTFSHYLGTLIRTDESIDEDRAQALGAMIAQTVMVHFKDRLWCSVIAEEARGLFMPEPRRKVLRALLQGLASNSSTPTRHKSALPTSTVVALLADIHANAPALERALAYLQQRNITEMLVMGDVVGYGPHPQQCVEMLSSVAGARVVQGNHDHAVVTQNYSLGFSAVSKWVIEWSRGQLSEKSLAWLDALPLYLEGDKWLAVHGAPNDKTFFNAYVYQMSYEDNLANMQSRDLHLCFHGHTHLQKVYYRKRGHDQSSAAERQQIGEYEQALICPGSVGQPRNGKPGVELALLDMQSYELEFIRLDYDMSATLRDMGSFGFPPQLIERLSGGR